LLPLVLLLPVFELLLLALLEPELLLELLLLLPLLPVFLVGILTSVKPRIGALNARIADRFPLRARALRRLDEWRIQPSS
jgi:hypothetical protein